MSVIPVIHNPHLDGSPFFWQGEEETGVLLTHGLTATAAEVKLLAKNLHNRGYTVAGPLLPGHGTTPQDLSRTTWQDWVQGAEEVYGQLADKCRQVFIGGESMGGAVSLYLAGRHPEAAGVMVYAPAIKLNLRRFDPLLIRLMALANRSMLKGGIDASEQWQGYPQNPMKSAQQLLNLQKQVIRQLASIKMPVLVALGKHDTTVDPVAGQIIMQGVRSTLKELHWFEQSSHVVILDQELDQVTELTVAFMKKALAYQTRTKEQ